MGRFQYKAKNKDAENVQGRMEADSREDAVEKIHQLGLVPVSVDELKHAEAGPRGIRSGRVTFKDRFRFSRQLVSLIKAGVPLLRALEIISAQTKNLHLRDVIDAIHASVKGGKSFSESLAEFPRIFSFLYITLVKAGEESGRLKESLLRISQYQRLQQETAAKIRMAFAYPLLMLVFGFGTIVFILTYVMPKITSLYVNLNQELPTPTVVVMRISDFCVHYWAIGLIALLAVFLFFKRWFRTEAGQQFQSRFKILTPVLGPFWVRVELARFCRAMNLLLVSGISIVRAIQLSIPVVRNPLLQQELTRCQEELLAGRSFGETLKQCRWVPEMVGHLISVGEESGALGDTLTDLSDSFESEIEENIKVMTTLLEPMMIVLVGAVVGFIVVAMLLPIFQLDVFAR